MPKKAALLIANSDYSFNHFGHLVTPGNDVQCLEEVLRAPDICGFDEVAAVINEKESVIRRKVARFFNDKRNSDDMLLVYFSGHGVLDEQGLLYLAVRDTEPDNLNATAIAASFMCQEMNRSVSRRQVLILDCCHSGAYARNAKGALGVTVGTSTAFSVQGYGRFVLTASDSTQFAWEGDKIIGEAATSVFTHWLVHGLQTGEADRNHTGRITLDDLYDYVHDQVVQETAKQVPLKFVDRQVGQFIIASSPYVVKSRPPQMMSNKKAMNAPASSLASKPYLSPNVVEHGGRLAQLEGLIREAQSDIQHYENDLLNVEQPERRREANQKIKSKRELMLPWLDEAMLLGQQLGKRLPSDIVEIALGCGFTVPPELQDAA